jgi:uncharacterized DUF497 family protein
MRFAWDEVKNRRNLGKHKISFETARLVFDGEGEADEVSTSFCSNRAAKSGHRTTICRNNRRSCGCRMAIIRS